MTIRIQTMARPLVRLTPDPLVRLLPRKRAANNAARPLPTPVRLEKLHALTKTALKRVEENRSQIIDILEGRDERVIAVVGPCSEDDSLQPDGTPSVVKYAREIKKFSQNPKINKKLLVVMRCNPAKPRSDLGMAGLEQKDVATAHKLLAEIVNLGIPLALEVMSPEHIARYGKLASLPWVGARNNRDTLLRHALSAHPEMPVMVKNDEYGELKSAVQAVKTINEPHENARITLPNGRTGLVARTKGNPHTGLIWRGGSRFMSPAEFEKGLKNTVESGLPFGVDCSHGNTMAHDAKNDKSVVGQKACFDHLLKIIGKKTLPVQPKLIMLESYLLPGQDTTCKTPGKSWTDPCFSLKDTKAMLTKLASTL